VTRNIFLQRVIIFIFFIGIIIITVITALSISKNLLETDKSSTALIKFSQVIENLLKKELSRPAGRFTRFFISENYPVFATAKDYQKAYDSFTDDEYLFYKNLLDKIKFIEFNLKNRNSLPVFFDNSSQYLFYPLNNINAVNQEELSLNFKQAFLKKDYIENRGNNLANSQKLLNYIYIKLFPDKKFLILISPPIDPDPLYPNNKRQVILICLQQKEAETKPTTSHIEKVILTNKN
jgi:hypothetical protein